VPGKVDVQIVPPGPPVNLREEVIDNNVLLRWSAPYTGTLPIKYYEIRKGDVFGSAEVIGQVQGTFSVVFETEGNTYTYWVAGIDTANNMGTEVWRTATVNEPPDYVLLVNWEDDLSGDVSNALLESNRLIMPVNLTETYAEHFTTRGWTTPQDQIGVGYEHYLEPVPSTSYYEQTFDYEQTIALTTKITLNLSHETIDGSPDITPQISVALDDGGVPGAWTDYTGGEYEIVESNFQYVKVRVTVASVGGDDLLSLEGLSVKLDLKERTDSGRVQILDQGQTVTFNVDFLDVISLTITPEGTTPLYAIYDFVDETHTTGFDVYVFDEDGVYVDNVWISWQAKGV
jgi:hypothetical protein